MFFQPKKEEIQRLAWTDKRFFVANAIVFVALVATYWFLVYGSATQAFFSGVVFMIAFPLVATKKILSEPLAVYGIRWGTSVKDIASVVIGSILFLGFVALFMRVYPISSEEFLPNDVRLDFLSFFLYIVGVCLSLIGPEILFRGIVLFSWERMIGFWSIVVQSVLCVLWMVLKDVSVGNFEWWRTVFYGAWTLLAGWVAWKSQSIFYSYLFSVFSVILMVVLALKTI